jgi:hypothetical protein
MRAKAAVLLVVLLLGASACGDSSTTTTTTSGGKVVVSCHIRLAKTKFALHTGIAAAGFYRYIYKPYRAGAFQKGDEGRRKALVKAAAAAAVAAHELRVASKDARCDGPALKKLAAPLDAVVGPLDSLRGLPTGGGLGAIATAQAALSRLTKASADAGVPVQNAR